MEDIIIIGAGVTGCAIARELSRDQRKTLVLEKGSDVCVGTSKANSGIVHAGHDAKPGTLKAKLNLEGNLMMPQLAKDLDIPFVQNGSLVLCFDESQFEALEELYQQGLINRVKGLKVLDTKELLEMEPNLNPNVLKGLYAPTGGIICPFDLVLALAENAYANGVKFKFTQEVVGIEKNIDHYIVKTMDKCYQSKIVINAAGVNCDLIHNLICNEKMKIVPRKGQYVLFDKTVGSMVSKTIFQLPTKLGKGVLVTPTVHGNLMIGPDAIDCNREEINTTIEGQKDIVDRASLSIKQVPYANQITSFAGLRAHNTTGDFIIKEDLDNPGYFDVAGIESPGLTSAPAIGKYVYDLVGEKYPAKAKENFIKYRKGITKVMELPLEKRNQLIAKNPLYGQIVCFCENVSAGEIIEAINRPLSPTTIDGLKRRIRVGMGKCQSGFCLNKSMKLLSQELNKDIFTITKNGKHSTYLVGLNKEVNHE